MNRDFQALPKCGSLIGTATTNEDEVLAAHADRARTLPWNPIGDVVLSTSVPGSRLDPDGAGRRFGTGAQVLRERAPGPRDCVEACSSRARAAHTSPSVLASGPRVLPMR
jgi:hypothetical protein